MKRRCQAADCASGGISRAVEIGLNAGRQQGEMEHEKKFDGDEEEEYVPLVILDRG
jgi:hypothetical protein